MKRIVFLDIDGVLNSNFWNDSHQREISSGTLIDKDKIRILAQLVKKTDAKIILHSGWRFWFDSELKPLRIESKRLVEMLADEDLVIDGVTPDLTTEEIRKTKKFSLVKADEILLWLKSHDDVVSWVVLDDLDLHNIEIEQYQVKTNQKIGLTIEDIRNAEQILRGHLFYKGIVMEKEYVFHGSPVKVEKLIPNQACDIEYKEGCQCAVYATTNKIMAILFSMGCIQEGDNAQRVMMPEYGDKMIFKNCHPNYNEKGYLYYLEKSKFVHAMGSQWVCFDEIVPDFIEEIDVNDYLEYCIIEK